MRFADMPTIATSTLRQGEQVKESITQFLVNRLKLRVNEERSSIDRPWKRKFLGYSMTMDKEPKREVAPESEKRLRLKLKALFRQGRGWSVKRAVEATKRLLIGWANYFKLSAVKGIFERLDQWIRRRLRCIIWRQ